MSSKKLAARAIVAFLLFFLILAVCLSFTGCQSAARNWGGTSTLDLPDNMKLLEITWKGEDSLWYLIRPMRDGEEAEEYRFEESSNLGFIEGTVIVKEHKK